MDEMGDGNEMIQYTDIYNTKTIKQNTISQLALILSLLQ